MGYWPHILAIIVGAGLTVQIGMNGTISRIVGSPVLASAPSSCSLSGSS